MIENEGPLKRKIPQIFKSFVYKEFQQEKRKGSEGKGFEETRRNKNIEETRMKLTLPNSL